MLDVGCGTARLTGSLLALVPQGRVLAIDASVRAAEVDKLKLAFGRWPVSALLRHEPVHGPETSVARFY